MIQNLQILNGSNSVEIPTSIIASIEGEPFLFGVNMKEWKRIKGFEDYLISDKGIIISTKFSKRKEMKRSEVGSGYLQVQLCKNNKPITIRVYKLVALHFIDNPLGCDQINHKDGNKKNNQSINLEWCTAKENTIHAIKNGLRRTKIGGNNNFAKLTDIEVLKIKERLLDKEICLSIAKDYGVDRTTVNLIKNKKTWQHLQ